MSSTLLSRPIDVSRFGLIYAGAQKNIGPAGLAHRDRARGLARARAPRNAGRHRLQDDGRERLDVEHAVDAVAGISRGSCSSGSKSRAGSRPWAKINERKAAKLYAAIDGSGFYKNPVEKACRSWMNIPFTLPDAELDKPFLARSRRRRASPISKVTASSAACAPASTTRCPKPASMRCVAFMADFAKRHEAERPHGDSSRFAR